MSLICGPFIPLMKIAESMGLRNMLKTHLTEDESNRVMAFALSKIVRTLPQNSIQSWYEGTCMSTIMPANLSSKRNSELLEKIDSSDLYRSFSLDLIDLSPLIFDR